LNRKPHEFSPSEISQDPATLFGTDAPYHSKSRWHEGEKKMLWTIFVVLLVLWLVGFIGFHVVAWYIHVLLLIALVVLLIQLIGGRRTV
jgi:cell division protein FtsW (lipid II flippase)